MPKKSTDPLKIWSSFQLWHFFKVAQSYPHGPKLAQLTVLSTGQGQGQVTKGHYIQKSHCGHVIHVVWPILAIEFDGSKKVKF